jgi:anti-anti-sigma regulatory factor
VIDLRRVTSIDERGVTMLMMEHGRLAGQGRELILAWLTPPVRRVLNRMGMNDIVVIRTTPLLPHTNSTLRAAATGNRPARCRTNGDPARAV